MEELELKPLSGKEALKRCVELMFGPLRGLRSPRFVLPKETHVRKKDVNKWMAVVENVPPLWRGRETNGHILFLAILGMQDGKMLSMKPKEGVKYDFNKHILPQLRKIMVRGSNTLIPDSLATLFKTENREFLTDFDPADLGESSEDEFDDDAEGTSRKRKRAKVHAEDEQDEEEALKKQKEAKMITARDTIEKIGWIGSKALRKFPATSLLEGLPCTIKGYDENSGFVVEYSDGEEEADVSPECVTLSLFTPHANKTYLDAPVERVVLDRVIKILHSDFIRPTMTYPEFLAKFDPYFAYTMNRRVPLAERKRRAVEHREKYARNSESIAVDLAYIMVKTAVASSKAMLSGKPSLTRTKVLRIFDSEINRLKGLPVTKDLRDHSVKWNVDLTEEERKAFLMKQKEINAFLRKRGEAFEEAEGELPTASLPILFKGSLQDVVDILAKERDRCYHLQQVSQGIKQHQVAIKQLELERNQLFKESMEARGKVMWDLSSYY